MARSITLNGSTYSIPSTGDNSWSATGGVDDYLVALATGVLQKAGGAFTLSAETDFGASYGLKAIYLKSRATNVAATGVIRLGNAEGVTWRNAANGGDLVLKANASDALEFNGNPVVTLALGAGNTALVMNAGGTAYSWASIANANIDAAAAIAVSKLAALTASKALVSDGSGFISASAVTATEIGYVSGVTSAVQTQLNTNAGNISTNATNISSHTSASTGVHGIAGSVVGTSDSQTLSNKTLGSTNTLTGATAASFSNSGTITLPTGTRTLVGRDTTDTLTNKTLTAPAVSDYAQLAEASAPATPSAGQARLFASTDSKLKFVNSAGLTKTLGDAGSGEINVIANSSDATNWVASGAGVTVATTTSSTDLPLSGVTDTAIKITPVSGTDYARYRWTMPASLKGRKLKVEWHQRPLAGYAAGDFKVDVYVNSASNYGGSYTRMSLSTDSSSVSSAPNQTGKYTTTVDADTSDYYELRITRTAGTTALNICNVIVGPGIQPQGAAVGEWQSYTPTGGWVSNATYTGKWRRVGDTMELDIRVGLTGAPTATTLRPSLPSGYTIDASKLNSTSPLNETFGEGFTKAGGSNYYPLVASYNDSTSFRIYYTDDTASGVQLIAEVSSTVPNTFASGDIVSLKARVPIAEWSGSGTVNVAQNEQEFSSNSSVSDAADTTSFISGPSGSSFPGALTANRSKRVRFVSPISPNDRIAIEVDPDGVSQWAAIEESRIGGSNDATHGLTWQRVSSSTTDIDVNFGSAGFNATGLTSAAAWSTLSSGKWRVRKVSGGQAVGFGEVNPGASSGLVSASGLKGRTDGVALGVGYVGEVYRQTITAVQNAASTGTYLALATITLPAGVYMISATASLFVNGATISGDAEAAVTATSASGSGTSYSYDVIDFRPGTTGEYPAALPAIHVRPTSSTAYYLNVLATYSAGTPKWRGTIIAVRIA